MTELLGTVVLLALVALVFIALADMLVGLFPWGWRQRRCSRFNTWERLASVRGIMRLRPLQPRTVLIILVVIFAWFVWPTPYRDLPCSTGAASYGACMHINRMTGAVCPMSQMCWWR